MAQPHLIIYVDENFGGLHTHIFESTSDFTQIQLGGSGSGINGNWNDKTSSFVIVSGIWLFFKDINYGPAPSPSNGLGPGVYSWVENFGIANDTLSSVQCIGQTP